MKMKTVEKNNQNIIYFENNNTTAQTVWSSFDQSCLIYIAFLSKFAHIIFEMHDKCTCIAGDPYQAHFLISNFLSVVLL